MSGIDGIEAKMRENPKNIKFTDIRKVCDAHFGIPRNRAGSHVIYKTPWPGDPRVNIQNKDGMAKPYQVKQVLEAIEKMKEMSGVD
ncbi:toxin HicA [Glutamicibacter sp. BW80]|uniref:toxin HicA n=1 Tax=Glutamicibacter TaxID=1742989 RepID=UPI000BB7448D|nr:toxin HicA [Glutamicibacter sp. BW80]